MNPHAFAVAVFISLSWGCVQASAEDNNADEGKSIEELREEVSELVARVEALERQLAKTQAGSVAPDFAISVAKLTYRASEQRPHYQQLPAALRINGVNEGMRIDAIEHEIRWQRATSTNQTFGLPDNMPKAYAR